jgi:hypothetical protein
MMLYILFSFTLGAEGGFFELKGKDVVSPSFGPSYGIFGDFYVTPNLSYELSFQSGKATASTRTMFIDTLGDIHSGVAGEDFECFKGALSVNWFPFKPVFSPYVSARLGLVNWKFVSGDNVARSLNGNELKGISLALGGGSGLRAEIAGFVLSAEAFSDFIFSEDKDWISGFGGYDDNEWTVEVMFKLGREF